MFRLAHHIRHPALRSLLGFVKKQAVVTKFNVHQASVNATLHHSVTRYNPLYVGRSLNRQCSTQSNIAAGNDKTEVANVFANDHQMQILGLDHSKRMVSVTWTDGQTDIFPYLWLRDNCQCNGCFHPEARARLILMRDLYLDATPTEANLKNDSKSLKITWDDGHVSEYDSGWLWKRRFNDHAQEERKQFMRRKPKLWGAEMVDKLPKYDFNQVLNDDVTQYKWLCDMEDYGISLIHDAPKEEGCVHKIAYSVGFPRYTHYGPAFTVVSKSDPSNLAYTSGTLGLHTDIPYSTHPPGVQLLHCIKQTKADGALSEFSDAFNAADIMQLQHPDSYRLLCNVHFDYIDVGADHWGTFSHMDPHFTFTFNSDTDLVRVAYSNQCRDTYQRVSPDDVEPVLGALRLLDDILYRQENIIRFKLNEGEVVIFNNNRVLHGRSSYEERSGTARHLQGTYIDWDQCCSRRRILAHKLGLVPDIG